MTLEEYLKLDRRFKISEAKEFERKDCFGMLEYLRSGRKEVREGTK
jgi:hypothetical protein